MGQYYKPVNMDNLQYVYSHDVKFRWKGRDGKYMTLGNGLKLMEHSWIGNGLMRTIEGLLIPGGAWYRCHLVWAGDYADEDWYDKVENEGRKILPKLLSLREAKKYRYIVNHTKKEYTDKEMSRPGRWQMRIHPLSLLTCNSNGRGGGDYYAEDPQGLIGRWAGDKISLEKEAPEGYTLIDFDLVEN